MTNFAHGRAAEDAAADYLEREGFEVLERNWRTRRCEIDIVARRGSAAYLCEVKYRLNESQGSGAEYITPKKLRQMHFAAEVWAQTANWPGDLSLAVIEVSGPTYEITEFITDV